jgi:hypothetical protein
MVTFSVSFGLIFYYHSQRPRDPLPDRGWTEQLIWTHRHYGTYKENERLHHLHEWFFPFILLAYGGAQIKMLYKKNELWRAE